MHGLRSGRTTRGNVSMRSVQTDGSAQQYRSRAFLWIPIIIGMTFLRSIYGSSGNMVEGKRKPLPLGEVGFPIVGKPGEGLSVVSSIKCSMGILPMRNHGRDARATSLRQTTALLFSAHSPTPRQRGTKKYGAPASCGPFPDPDCRETG